MEEHFTYDRLNRLTGIIEVADTTGVFAYDAYGRMTSKKMHGAMVFDGATFNAGGRPHAIAEAQAYGDPVLPNLQFPFSRICNSGVASTRFPEFAIREPRVSAFAMREKGNKTP